MLRRQSKLNRYPKLTFLLIAILIATILFSSTISLIKSPSSTILSVKPSTINPTLVPGDTFTINCSVTNVVDLFTWQIKLFFNPTILNCSGAWYPSDHVFAGKTGIPVTPIINNVTGYVLHGYSLMGTELGFNGNGTLCQIEFKVKSRGKSSLNYSEPYGGDTFLLDSNLDVIQAVVKNGYFNNTHDVAITQVLPSKTSVELGDTLPVNVTVENQGALTETFNVNVYFNTTKMGTQTVTSLPAGTSRTITIVCDTADLQKGDYLVSANATIVPYETDIADNTLTDGTIKIIAYHDVAVTGVTPSKTQVIQGLSMSIYATVENQGHYTETFAVTVFYDANPIETKPLTLNRKTSTVLSFKWNTTGVPLGNYTISAEASQVPDEIETADNTFINGNVSVIPAPPPNIALIEVKPFKTVVMQDFCMHILVTVENQGVFTETFNLTTYIDAFEIETEEITLEGATSTTITFILNATGFELYRNFTLSAYVHPILGEANTDDNHYTDGMIVVAIVGDIAPDKKVDMKDIATVAKAFGSYPGHARWNPNADVTGAAAVPDDKVDMMDIAAIAKEFGKTYP